MKKIVLILALFFIVSVQSIFASSYRISVSQFAKHPSLDAVLQGFQDYLKEHSIEAEYSIYLAQGDMAACDQIAQKMIHEKVDLLLAITTPSAQSCVKALAKIPKNLRSPLVFSAVTDPIAAGLIKDPQYPKNNVTGVSDLLPIRAHMGMLFQFVHKAQKIGVLYNPKEVNSQASVKAMQEVAKDFHVEIITAKAEKPANVYEAAKSLVGKVDLIFLPTDNTVISALDSVLKVGYENKVPVFSADADSVVRGAVAAVGFDYYKHGYQTGAMAKRVLKGEKIKHVPVEYQMEFQLSINVNAAKKMGIVLSEDLLKQAHKVIK